VGRKPTAKKRIENPSIRREWAMRLTPVYLKEGLKQFTMDDAARHLGVSKATLYKHFKSRESILEYALTLKLEQIGSFKNNLFDENLSFIDRYISAIHLFSTEISGISNRFLSDLKHLYPQLWKKVIFFRNYAVELLRQFYQAGIEKGYFNDINPSVLAVNDKLFFETISDPDFLENHKLQLQDAFDSYFKLRCYGIFRNTADRHMVQKKLNRFVREPS
jgi:AcrR family transcriptional regulator